MEKRILGLLLLMFFTTPFLPSVLGAGTSAKANDYFVKLIANEADITKDYSIFQYCNPDGKVSLKDISVSFVGKKHIDTSTLCYFQDSMVQVDDSYYSESCSPYQRTELNGTNTKDTIENCSMTYHPSTKQVSKRDCLPLSSKADFKIGDCVDVMLTATHKPQLGHSSVDWVPSTISDSATISKTDWAWWNSDWLAKRTINITETLGISRVRERLIITLNTSGAHAIVKCSEVRIVDNTSVAIPYQIIENSAPNCRILFEYNITRNNPTDNTTIYTAYYNSTDFVDSTVNQTLRVVSYDFDDGLTTGWSAMGDYAGDVSVSVTSADKISYGYSMNITGNGGHNALAGAVVNVGEQNLVWFAKVRYYDYAAGNLYFLMRGTGTSPAGYLAGRYLYPGSNQIAIDNPNVGTPNSTTGPALDAGQWHFGKVRTVGATSANMEFTIWNYTAYPNGEYDNGFDVFANGVTVTGTSKNFGFGVYELSGNMATLLVDDVEGYNTTYEPRFYKVNSGHTVGNEVLLYPDPEPAGPFNATFYYKNVACLNGNTLRTNDTTCPFNSTECNQTMTDKSCQYGCGTFLFADSDSCLPEHSANYGVIGALIVVLFAFILVFAR